MNALQATAEWRQARLGKVTASRISDLFGTLAVRENYLDDLFLERRNGIAQVGYESEPMKIGKEREPEAIKFYQLETGLLVNEVGFVDHPTIANSGASPDGLVGKAGLVEVKCPTPRTHLRTIRSVIVDVKYIMQIQWQLACTGRAWCDFVSYHPDYIDQELWVRRVERSDEAIAKLETEVRRFLAELESRLADKREAA
jgi:exodeoxyribonuclease (lambda-induced)